jgi:glycosyltransferase involved in cell wall biosynthesis
MRQQPLVTIGLPVYNSERFVEQSLNSLLGQTYPDFVLIISDNASTDSTPLICKRYAEADARIKYLRNPANIGNPRNFNRIAELTETPFLKWATADDYWDKEFLARAMEIMQRDPSLALCHPQAFLVDAEGANAQPYDDVLDLRQDDPAERFVALLERIKLAHQHLGVIRMSHLRRTHLLGTHVGSDINLLAELALYGKFFQMPERLFYRRFHKDSGSWKRGDTEHERRRYHASSTKRAPLRVWPQHLAFFGAVRRSPLPAASKWRLYRYLARRMYWNHRALMDELAHSVGLGSR